MTAIPLPQGVFLDWDGTLVDSYEFLQGAHNYVRSALGFPTFKGDEFKNYFGKPRDKLYDEIYGAKNDQARELFGQYVRKNHVKDLKPMPGADQLLRVMKDLGLTLGVVSNKKAEFLHLEIESYGWQGYFSSVVGAGDAAHDKPSADPLLLAVEKAGFRHGMENLWYVGDTDIDLQCAKNAKCPCVFITNGEKHADGWIETYKPFLIFANCAELTEFLLQYQKNPLKTKQV